MSPAGDVIDRVTGFFSLARTATLSAHGLIAASALALFIWPPPPVDRIHEPTNFADVLSRNAQCAFDEQGEALDEAPTLSMRGIKHAAVVNQDRLERAKGRIEQCIARDTSHVGDAADQIANAEYDIKQLEVERTALQGQYLAYVRSLSELRLRYKRDLDLKTNEVRVAQLRINGLHNAAKQLQLHLDLENLYLKTIADRLAEPGRLRPRHSFDDVLAGVTSHVIGFATLAMLLGYGLDPFNRMLSTASFDSIFFLWLNRLRKSRYPVMRLKTPASTAPLRMRRI